MGQPRAEVAFRPPRQARSRMSLQKVLVAAEHVLATGGLEKLTVAGVAEQAGVSVGVIYQRFAGKDQLLHAVKAELLGRLEAAVIGALNSADDGLEHLVGAFTRALADTFSQHDRLFPELLSGQLEEGVERGLDTLATIQDALVEASAPHEHEITRSADPRRAVRIAARNIAGSCVHRAATCRSWPDELTWSDWADETTALAMAYLTTRPGRTAR